MLICHKTKPNQTKQTKEIYCSIDKTRGGTCGLGNRGPENKGNEEVCHTP